MAEAQMAGSHYESDGQGDAEKLLINFYPEFTGADPSRSLRLVNTPGSRIIDDGTTLSGVVRGMTRKDGYLSGDLAFVDGTTFRRYNPSTDSFSTLTGTVAGSARVQFAIAQDLDDVKEAVGAAHVTPVAVGWARGACPCLRARSWP